MARGTELLQQGIGGGAQIWGEKAAQSQAENPLILDVGEGVGGRGMETTVCRLCLPGPHRARYSWQSFSTSALLTLGAG